MTEAKTNGGTEVNALGAMFDLDAHDAELLEEFCSTALQEAGVDGRQFFERLRSGERFGAALGLPDGVSELIYARAHRWFLVDRADRAEPLFRALCVADGKVPDYWVGLGVCLRMRNDLAGAGLAFAMAAKLRPDWAVPAFHACELAIHSGDMAGAERQLKRFRSLADASIPQRMVAEVERMAAALELRRSASAEPGR